MENQALLHQGIRDSGFPFELRIATELIGLGWEVCPSVFFFDRDRKKDAELDLLAVRQLEFSSSSGSKVAVTLRIAIECKDASRPFVCFGLPFHPPSNSNTVGREFLYPHFRTSRDRGIKGRFRIVLFHPHGGENPEPIRHHHYTSAYRFHTLATAVKRGGGNRENYKVSSPDEIRYALGKLGSYVGLNDAHDLSDSQLEEIAEGLYLNFLFTALVHPGEHFRFKHSDDSLEASGHTPLFLSRSYDGESLYYVADLISAESLAAAIERIVRSCEAMVQRVVPYMKAVD